MQINQVTHERVRNLGDYESARVTLVASVDETDDVHEVMETLRAEAKWFLYPDKRESK